jgi:hypothetical protein
MVFLENIVVNKLFIKTDKMQWQTLLVLACVTIGTLAVSDSDIQGLVNWAVDNGAHFHPHVSIAFIDPIYGRGFTATQDITAGQHVDLVSFPLNMALSTLLVQDSNISKIMLACDVDELSGTNLHAFHYAFLRRHFKINDDNSELWGSFWAPYVKSIPDLHEISSPIAYSSQELSRLQGTILYEMCDSRSSKAKSSYNSIMRSLKLKHCRKSETKLPRDFFDDLKEKMKEVTQDDFLWGLAVIWSRNFATTLQTSEGKWDKMNSLMPLADMFNAAVVGRRANTLCLTDKNSDRFVCKLGRNVTAGDQLLVDYSSAKLSNFRLMIDYGFVSDDNPYREVYVKLPEAPESGKKWLTLIGFQPTTSTPTAELLLIGPRNWGWLKMFFIILTAKDEYLPEKHRDHFSVQTVFGKGKTFYAAHETNTYVQMISYLTHALESYPTSLEEDAEELASLDRSKDSHMHNILKFLISEKTVLKDIIGEVTAEYEKQQETLREKIAAGEDINSIQVQVPKQNPGTTKSIKLDMDELKRTGTMDLKDEL